MSTATVTETKLITAEEFMQMDFECGVELVRGRIVEMPPAEQPHGSIAARVVFALANWAIPDGVGEVTSNDSGLVTGENPDTVRGPDVCFYFAEQLPEGKVTKACRTIPPTLCVEVRSPSNRWSELLVKVGEYLGRGVREVWIVDPDDRSVRVFRDIENPRTFNESETLTSDILPEFSTPLTEFFGGV